MNDKETRNNRCFRVFYFNGDSHLVTFLLLHQTLVVPRNFHCQIFFCLDQELHPRFTLLQEGLLLQQEGLELAGRNQLTRWNTSYWCSRIWFLTFLEVFCAICVTFIFRNTVDKQHLNLMACTFFFHLLSFVPESLCGLCWGRWPAPVEVLHALDLRIVEREPVTELIKTLQFRSHTAEFQHEPLEKDKRESVNFSVSGQ